MNIKKIVLNILVATFAVSYHSPGMAQGGADAVRAAIVIDMSNKQKNAIKGIDVAQSAMSVAHIWYEDEVSSTTNFQKQFNEYLDQFHEDISTVAEVYGIYHECKKTGELVSALKNVVGEHPWNPAAVAFHSKRNDIYTSIYTKGAQMLVDIRKICFEKNKLTEYEQDKIVSSLRPRLREINRDLSRLYLYLKYTTMLDVWHEIEGKAESYRMDRQTKKEIAQGCVRRWKKNAGKKIR